MKFQPGGFMVRFNAIWPMILNLAHRAFSMTERWLGGVVPHRSNTEADDARIGVASYG